MPHQAARHDESSLPSAAGVSARFGFIAAVINGTFMLVAAAFWHQFMPIAHPVLRTLGSLVLLVFPLTLVLIGIRRLTAQLLLPIGQTIEAIENIALGRLDTVFPVARTSESERMNNALTIMLRRLRTSIAGLEKASQTDALTQLSNRSHFKAEVEVALRDSGAVQGGALLLLDLDRFKAVNDSFGHGGGDRLLSLFAQRMIFVLGHFSESQQLARAPLMARLGGDEFAIFVFGPIDTAAVMQLSHRILKTLEDPFDIGPAVVNISTSVGIALAPQDGDHYDMLVRNADLALLQAKQLGKRNFQLFNEALKRQALARVTIETQLRGAIDSEAFEVHYQPQICAATRVVVGVEALARWRHPTLGIMLPAKFIAVAEEYGLIGQIGLQVMRQAIAQAAQWHHAGRSLRMAVNVAAVQLKQGNFAHQVRDLLEAYQLPAWLLELELTETLAMQDTHEVQGQLRELRTLGVSLAIDDFGTGYSNLALLRRLDFDRLKIDRSFISGVDVEEDARMIVSTVLAMAHAMDFEVVAEGVESARQATILQAAGCAILQGFHISKPLTAKAFDQWREDYESGIPAPMAHAQVA